jgi:hypothetical protein
VGSWNSPRLSPTCVRGHHTLCMIERGQTPIVAGVCLPCAIAGGCPRRQSGAVPAPVAGVARTVRAQSDIRAQTCNPRRREHFAHAGDFPGSADCRCAGTFQSVGLVPSATGTWCSWRRAAKLPVVRLVLLQIGLLEDRSAVFGVLEQLEALGLEPPELPQIREAPEPPPTTEPRALDGRHPGSLRQPPAPTGGSPDLGAVSSPPRAAPSRRDS